eukprot:SAG31_NODE_9260_length_1307_cov_1.448675_1_plen_233_part_00
MVAVAAAVDCTGSLRQRSRKAPQRFEARPARCRRKHTMVAVAAAADCTGSLRQRSRKAPQRFEARPARCRRSYNAQPLVRKQVAVRGPNATCQASRTALTSCQRGALVAAVRNHMRKYRISQGKVASQLAEWMPGRAPNQALVSRWLLAQYVGNDYAIGSAMQVWVSKQTCTTMCVTEMKRLCSLLCSCRLQTVPIASSWRCKVSTAAEAVESLQLRNRQILVKQSTAGLHR